MSEEQIHLENHNKKSIGYISALAPIVIHKENIRQFLVATHNFLKSVSVNLCPIHMIGSGDI